VIDSQNIFRPLVGSVLFIFYESSHFVRGSVKVTIKHFIKHNSKNGILDC